MMNNTNQDSVITVLFDKIQLHSKFYDERQKRSIVPMLDVTDAMVECAATRLIKIMGFDPTEQVYIGSGEYQSRLDATRELAGDVLREALRTQAGEAV